MKKLSGKIAVVTGASRGLGKAMAIALAQEGASVAVAARTVEAGQSPLPGTIHETVSEIGKLGGKATAIRCDVTREEDAEALINQVNKDFGRVDILINNAVDFISMAAYCRRNTFCFFIRADYTVDILALGT